MRARSKSPEASCALAAFLGTPVRSWFVAKRARRSSSIAEGATGEDAQARGREGVNGAGGCATASEAAARGRARGRGETSPGSPPSPRRPRAQH